MTYQLPHPLDRPGQEEAFDWIMDNPKRFLLVRAPTGSGKSAWAAEASKTQRVLTLVETKSLQAANYRDTYSFDILYGKSNYPCEDEDRAKLHYTAFDCSNPDCDCPYNKAVEYCLGSERLSLNYAKYLLSKSFVDAYQPEMLFLDEAHNLPDIVMEFTGLTLRWENEFIQYKNKPQEAMQLTHAEAMRYFRQCAIQVDKNRPRRDEDLPTWRRWKRLHQKIEIFDSIMRGSKSGSEWYYEVDEEKLLIKPLTGRFHFQKFFNKAPKIVLMSATIRPEDAERLGIEDFDYYEVANAWPAPLRLIYDLNAPRLNFRSSDMDREQQALLIASVCKSDKSGIIHVSSKFQAFSLSERLFELGVNTWLPTDGIGTDKQLEAWYNARRKGLYCISWAFHEGVDLGEDDIAILAKVPYGDISGNYERARMEYDQGYYLQKAAYAIEQACGRVRRGKPEHYLPGAKMVYLADGGWKRLKRLLSKDFVMSVRTLNGH